MNRISPFQWSSIFLLYGVSIIFITGALSFILPMYGYNFCLTYGIDKPNLSILALKIGFSVVYAVIFTFLFYSAFYAYSTIKKGANDNES